MIICEAPGRAGIIGNPTDGYGGVLIACAIPRRARVELEPADSLRLIHGERSLTVNWENDLRLQDDRFDLGRAVLRYLRPTGLNCELRMDTDIPRQAGLAGSTAMLSAILGAVLTATGRKFTPYYFAELNRIIELRYMKVHCGYQDAYMTTFGGLNFLDFRGKEYYRSLDEEFYAAVEPLQVEEMPFILAHSGVQHNSGDFHRPLRERWLEGDQEVIAGYEEITELALRGKRALLDRNWEELGYLMNENHSIQDELSFSGRQNNHLIAAAREGGALGAKLAGAGGGGTIIALTCRPEETRRALKTAGAEKLLELDPRQEGLTVSGEAAGDEVAVTS